MVTTAVPEAEQRNLELRVKVRMVALVSAWAIWYWLRECHKGSPERTSLLHYKEVRQETLRRASGEASLGQASLLCVESLT